MRIQEETWPNAIAIGAEGVSLAIAKLLRHKIVPCVPLIDIGYDLVSGYDDVVKRIQVKATTTINTARPDSTRFSLCKSKACKTRRGSAAMTKRRAYRPTDVDVFIFVHVRLKRFFIVPAAELDFRRHWITFDRASKWANAWHVLKTA